MVQHYKAKDLIGCSAGLARVKCNLTGFLRPAVYGDAFGGGETVSQFGQFAKDDNVYVLLSYEL